jgi:hypothetical protein
VARLDGRGLRRLLGLLALLGCALIRRGGLVASFCRRRGLLAVRRLGGVDVDGFAGLIAKRRKRCSGQEAENGAAQ